MGTIRSSHDWVATSKDDGVLRLQDDLNSVASDRDPRRSLRPHASLPNQNCYQRINAIILRMDSVVAIQNAAWSSFLWVELVVVVKFLGSQFSIIDPLKAKISSGSSSQTPAPSPPVSLVQER
ncbi:putative protein [Arabidopsis thaliana]|nr:putative protein [Arabidopsis thaliana]